MERLIALDVTELLSASILRRAWIVAFSSHSRAFLRRFHFLEEGINGLGDFPLPSYMVLSLSNPHLKKNRPVTLYFI
ncbi:hypothetical protein CHH80_10420 [Bacillus sp. 7504-2]|nr:hypothetical protein CHH80_10420 [Bacillus sp. 7504-2]